VTSAIVAKTIAITAITAKVLMGELRLADILAPRLVRFGDQFVSIARGPGRASPSLVIMIIPTVPRV
jgi:hypothetical protein